MSEPSNPPENRIPQTRRVSLLLTLELPMSFDTAGWPCYIHLNGLASSACWGLLDGFLDQVLENRDYVSVEDRAVKQWFISWELPEDAALEEKIEEMGSPPEAL